MRVTHVVRGEEWLSTLPIHYELFTTLGWDLPVYCHTAHLMKIDNGVKRKLSKERIRNWDWNITCNWGITPLQ